MPELPEVETTRRGIAPWLEGHRIAGFVLRDGRLRWPVPADLPESIRGARVLAVGRRAKYLLLSTDRGTALLHLGMSGSLRLVGKESVPGPHDHLDLIVETGMIVRFNDPRRFGSLHWTTDDPARHPLLADLGPEPLSDEFDGSFLVEQCRGRNVAIKPHLMNSRIVVGVGNIYASESLYRAGIHPARAAGRIRAARLEKLAVAIREVLQEAIRAGGTTLRDFHGGDGQPGYFSRELRVYDRGGQPCLACGTPLKHTVQCQRSTYYCPGCQR